MLLLIATNFPKELERVTSPVKNGTEEVLIRLRHWSEASYFLILLIMGGSVSEGCSKRRGKGIRGRCSRLGAREKLSRALKGLGIGVAEKRGERGKAQGSGED